MDKQGTEQRRLSSLLVAICLDAATLGLLHVDKLVAMRHERVALVDSVIFGARILRAFEAVMDAAVLHAARGNSTILCAPAACAEARAIVPYITQLCAEMVV